ncbi:MAG: tetratricopeptide repeat protein [bacterium]|nr:tetratricopeptide repeat protein [bacterium]
MQRAFSLLRIAMIVLLTSWLPMNSYASIKDSLQNLLKHEADPCKQITIQSKLVWEFLYDDIDKAEYYALRAVANAKKCPDKLGKSYAYQILGTTYLIRNLSSEALKNYFTSLKLKEEVGDSVGMAGVLNNVGIAYRYLDDYDNALRYYKKSLDITLKLKKNPADDYHNISLCYNLKGEHKKAIKYERKALNEYLLRKDSSEVADCYMGISYDYISQNKFETAIEYLDSAYFYAKQFEQNNILGGIYVNYATCYRQLHNYPKALDYAQKGYEATLGHTVNFDWHKNALNELSQAHANMGNMKKAYEYHVRYADLKDSLLNESKVKEATQLEMTYDFEKEQLADSLLHSQELKAEQTKTANEKRLNVLLFAIGGLLFLSLIGAVIAYRNKRKSAKIISAERQKSEELLLNILPKENAIELKTTGSSKPRPYKSVTILFTDFKGFTMVAEQLTAEELVNEIDYCFKAFDTILENYSIEKIKTIGDAYMCAGGLPTENNTHHIDVVNAAIDIRDWMLQYKVDRKDGLAFEIRIGLHTGPVVAGIVGTKKFAYDIWGDAVNTAARMESSGEVGKVNISGTTYEMVKDDFTCEYRGKIEAKNKGNIDMYFVERA